MSVEALLECMDKLNEIHMELTELAERKRQVLVENQVDELNAIIRRENRMLHQVNDLERERTQAIGRILIQRGYHPNPRVTVSDLIRLIFRADEKKALAEAQARLMGTLRELKRRNELNQQLIRQSLALIEYTLELAMGIPGDEAVYQNPLRRPAAGRHQRFFDGRA
jgi:flagellar biosynthesis/type III secretory pathway chaperone